MSWLNQLINPIQSAANQAVRMATTNPAIAPILRRVQSLPAPIREGLNPLTRRPTTSFRGGAGAAGVNLLRNTVIGGIADKLLPGVGSQLVNTGLNAETALWLTRVNPVVGGVYTAVVDPLLNPLPAGANEAAMLAQARREGWGQTAGMAQQTNAAVAAADESTQSVLSKPSPAPAAGPRVETSTVRTRAIPAAPPQSQQIAPVTRSALETARESTEASTKVPLSQFYAAQDFLGKELEKTGELQRRLKEAGGAAGMSDAALMAWAQKNPGLAYREMLRREQSANAMSAD